MRLLLLIASLVAAACGGQGSPLDGTYVSCPYSSYSSERLVLSDGHATWWLRNHRSPNVPMPYEGTYRMEQGFLYLVFTGLAGQPLPAEEHHNYRRALRWRNDRPQLGGWIEALEPDSTWERAPEDLNVFEFPTVRVGHAELDPSAIDHARCGELSGFPELDENK